MNLIDIFVPGTHIYIYLYSIMNKCHILDNKPKIDAIISNINIAKNTH